jgi:multiple sugar transport system substrate-binding protein
MVRSERGRMGFVVGVIVMCVTPLLVTPALLAAPQVEIQFDETYDPSSTSDPRAKAQNDVIAEFERMHPDIKVDIVIDGDNSNAVRTALAHAPAPDVLHLNTYLMLQMAESGGLAPLDELIKRDGLDPNDWLLPSTLTQVQGQTYAMQSDIRIPILIYRRHLLEAAHVSAPKTWDDVCRVGGILTRAGQIGYALPLGALGGAGGAQAFAEFQLSDMLAGDGGQYFASDHRAIAFSRDAFIRVAQTVRELYTTCHAATPPTLQFGYNEVQDGLRAGTVAMATFALYRYSTIVAQGAGTDLGWSEPPGYTATSKQAVFCNSFGLNQFSRNREAAWQFLRYLTSPEAQAIQAQGGEVVGRASAYKAPYFSTPAAQNQLAWAQLIKRRGIIVNYSIISSRFNQIVADAFQRMILEGRTPSQTYDEVVTNYAAALKDVK